MRVNFDDYDTWPDRLRLILESNNDLLSKYDAEERKILKLKEKRDYSPLNPASNPFRSDFEKIGGEINEEATKHSILGYHCTRLMPDEVEDIRARGMAPLSREFAMARLKKRLAAGDLTERAYNEICTNMTAGDDNRDGIVWFSFSHYALSDEWAVGNLLGCWGGEGIYMGLSQGSESFQALKALGAPDVSP